MSTRTFYDRLRGLSAATETGAQGNGHASSPWQIGHDLLARKRELEATGTSQGCTTLKEVFAAQHLSPSQGHFWLQVIEQLDELRYRHVPPGKLRCLLSFKSEDDRQAFLAAHDLEALSVRELKRAVRAWTQEGNGRPPSSEPTDPRQATIDFDADATNEASLLNALSQLVALEQKTLAVLHDIHRTLNRLTQFMEQSARNDPAKEVIANSQTAAASNQREGGNGKES